jgi:hypothetical protein
VFTLVSFFCLMSDCFLGATLRGPIRLGPWVEELVLVLLATRHRGWKGGGGGYRLAGVALAFLRRP